MSSDGLFTAEETVLAAVASSREAWDKLERFGFNPSPLSDAGRVLYETCRDQYKRDDTQAAVDRDLVRAAIVRRYGDGDMAQSILLYFEGLPSNPSTANLLAEWRNLRLRDTGRRLAALLASGAHGDETEKLVDEYRDLLQEGDDAGRIKWRLDESDFDDDAGGELIFLHSALKRFIGDGVRRGHNVVIFGRPNSGKSMLALDMAARACNDGYRVLYVCNEEPKHDVTKRLLSRLGGQPISKLNRDKQLVRQEMRRLPAYKRWHMLHKGNITVRDVQTYVARSSPDILVIDQLKNIEVREDNRALQLDKLARKIREIGIDNDCVTISVTQAGESAEQSLHLRMNDVEWSNTGIAGSADLMIGVGVDDHYADQNKRMLCICKNKLKNEHGDLPVYIDTERTMISWRPL